MNIVTSMLEIPLDVLVCIIFLTNNNHITEISIYKTKVSSKYDQLQQL